MKTTAEPAWLTAARGKLDTREVAGGGNSATIMSWAKRLGVGILGMVYNADSVPWCGLFVAACLQEGGIDLGGLHRQRIAVRAKAWAEWGARLRPDRLAPGALLIFGRTGGGHVGFYVGEDLTSYHVLGGNQGDCVSIARIKKDRLIASRWPRGVPVIGGPLTMSARAGVPLSRNEA